jgi:hypothetical protein
LQVDGVTKTLTGMCRPHQVGDPPHDMTIAECVDSGNFFNGERMLIPQLVRPPHAPHAPPRRGHHCRSHAQTMTNTPRSRSARSFGRQSLLR